MNWRMFLSATSLILLAACSSCSKDGENNNNGVELAKPGKLPEGKALYRPEEFQGQDWWSDKYEYSYNRMECTENLAIFWGKGFGKDPGNPPALEGHNMAVDMDNLKTKLERFYTYFRDTLEFIKPGQESIANQYRMMVMLMYSLEGTAYGGTYDDTIGAFWAAPNRLQDKTLNCVAHELGHSFQLQILADKMGDAWGGNGVYEMASQWMLWQVNPNWMEDENYHWDGFKEHAHKAYLHFDNIYHSPYVLQYWSEKHGLPVIAELFRQGKKGEDPVMTYKEMFSLSQEAYNDEMIDCYLHLMNIDYSPNRELSRKWANSFAPFKANLTAQADGWMQVKKEHCPENYGFNPIKLSVPAAGATVTVDFEGLPGANGYVAKNVNKAGWRYGMVGVTAEGESVLGTVGRDAKGQITYTTPADKPLAHLWLVVMGAPTAHWMNEFGENVQDAQWPYKVKVTGANIL